MQKRERLERAIAGEAVDRAPVALWRHWPGDDQRYADLARSTIDFQHDYNWDFLRVMPARAYHVVDYGVQASWDGDARGIRKLSKRAIKRSLEWTKIRPLSPARGNLLQQAQCLRLIGQAVQADSVPVLQTVYSPFVQAAQMAGRQKALRDMRLRPDRLRSGLNQLTESTMRFLDTLKKIPSVAGLFLVTDFASHDVMSESEYRAFILPHLRNILDDLPEHWWLNIVQVAGPSPMLSLFRTLPIQALNWDTRADPDSLVQAGSEFGLAACGGLHDEAHLLKGTPTLIHDAIRQALNQTESRRLIVSGSGDGSINWPLSNMRAVRSGLETQA